MPVEVNGGHGLLGSWSGLGGRRREESKEGRLKPERGVKSCSEETSMFDINKTPPPLRCHSRYQGLFNPSRMSGSQREEVEP